MQKFHIQSKQPSAIFFQIQIFLKIHTKLPPTKCLFQPNINHAVRRLWVTCRRMQRRLAGGEWERGKQCERETRQKEEGKTSYANVMRSHGHAAKWGVQVLNVITARDSLIVARFSNMSVCCMYITKICMWACEAMRDKRLKWNENEA